MTVIITSAVISFAFVATSQGGSLKVTGGCRGWLPLSVQALGC